MKELADDVYLLDGRPRYGYNIYLAGGLLVDAGSRHARGRILRQVADRPVAGHVVTHAHPDHQGASHAVCERLDIPLMCGAGDADAIASGDLSGSAPDHPVVRHQLRHWAGPGHPVARRLREGDEAGGFTVLETPGHTPGSICLWRERDRVLLVGDVLNNAPEKWGGTGSVAEAPPFFCLDVAGNRAAIRRLAALEPRLVLFGHGWPLRDPAGLAELTALAARLPA